MKAHADFYLATCPHGFEDLFIEELQSLSATQTKKGRGNVRFQCALENIGNLVLNTRLAGNIYRSIFNFPLHHPKDIYKKTKDFAWDDQLQLQQTFKIKCHHAGNLPPTFKNSIYSAQLLKDALVDFFKHKMGKRPDVELKNPDVNFYLYLEDKWANLYITLDQTTFSKRNYRASSVPHLAPLKENMAAGLCIQALKQEEGKRPDVVIDPFCGTGTLLIEYALLALNLPPSYLKILNHYNWSFEKALWFESQRPQFEKLKAELEAQIIDILQNKNLPFAILASDLDIKHVQENLKQAKLEHFIEIKKQNALQIIPPLEGGGIILTNPPYGERLGELEESVALYHDFGEQLKKNFKGFRAYIVAGHQDLRKAISLRTSNRFIFNNEGIECRLLKYDLY